MKGTILRTQSFKRVIGSIKTIPLHNQSSMLRLSRSSSSSEDDRYTVSNHYLEDDDSIEFVREDENDPGSGDGFELDFTHTRSLEPDGHMDHCDSEDEDERCDGIDLGILEGGNYSREHRRARFTYDDLEVETNETNGAHFISTGLYSDEGLHVNLETAMNEQKPMSSLMRCIIHARDDLAATFKDPKVYHKEKREHEKYRDTANFLDDLVAHTSSMLESSTESGSTYPVTEATHSSSTGSVGEANDVEQASTFNKKSIKYGRKVKLLKKEKGKASTESERPAHLRCCAHGIIWTFLSLSAGIIGSYSSISSHRSSHFASLEKPMQVAPIYNEVDAIGLFRLKVCFNKTETNQEGCETHKLSADDIDDTMFEVARILTSLAMLLGGLMTALLIGSLCWESINLKPIGFGYLGAYFFQSFAMLFFDTDICSAHECRMGTGCALCIGASLCWLVACVAVSRMDNFKIRALRRREYLKRLNRRNEREMRRKRKHLIRQLSAADTSKVLSINSSSQWVLPSPTLQTTFERSPSKYEC